MKCPLITAGLMADHETSITSSFDCLKEECAWWDEHTQKCAVLTIAKKLAGLIAAINTKK